MWKWIAHAIAVDKENMHEDIFEYKHKYLETMIALNLNLQGICETEEERKYYDELITYYRQTMVDMSCFCCTFRNKYINHAPQFEIVSDRSHKECRYLCPVVWEYNTLSGTKEANVICATSDYGIITNKACYKQWRKCCKLAYKIAMLPERSIEDYV